MYSLLRMRTGKLMHGLEPGFVAVTRAKGRPRDEPRTLGWPWNWVHPDQSESGRPLVVKSGT